MLKQTLLSAKILALGYSFFNSFRFFQVPLTHHFVQLAMSVFRSQFRSFYLNNFFIKLRLIEFSFLIVRKYFVCQF